MGKAKNQGKHIHQAPLDKIKTKFGHGNSHLSNKSENSILKFP